MRGSSRGREVRGLQVTPEQDGDTSAVAGELRGPADLVREAVRGLAASRDRLAGALVPLYIIALVILIAAAAVGKLRWSNSLYFLEDLKFAAGTGQGALTVVNGLMLGAAATLLAVVAHQLPLMGAVEGRAGTGLGERFSLPWLAFAALALVLALDEVLMAHEYVAYRLDRGGVPRVFGVIDQDFFVFSIYGVAVLTVLWFALPTIVEFGSAVLPLCAFGLFMIVSQMIDFVPWHELTRTQQQILGPAEEAFKCLGGFSLMLYGVVLAHDVVERRVEAARGARDD